jgi:UDP-N-acetylglucosamine pyrophosphorylase
LLRIFILLNEFNSFQIRQYLQQNKYFEFSSSQIEFCYQKSVAVVDPEGHLVFSDEMHPIVAPNGSGNVFQALQFINFQQKMYVKPVRCRFEQGIQYIHFIGCENLMAQPLDTVSLALMDESGVDVLCKCAEIIPGVPEQPVLNLTGEKVTLTCTNSSQQLDPEELGRPDSVAVTQDC